MPADAHNEGGYWEHVKFLALNEAILHEVGAAWDSPPPPTADWTRVSGLPRLRGRAEVLLDEFSAREPWAWKDPRTSLTLPFWRVLCPDLKVIICIRNPFEVAVSLRRRGGASYAFGIRLWLLYNRQLLDLFDPSRAVVMHYASVLFNPQREARRIADFLNLGSSITRISDASAAAQRPLRHSQFTTRDLLSAGLAREPLRLYLRLCQLAEWRDADDETAAEAVAAIARRFGGHSRVRRRRPRYRAPRCRAAAATGSTFFTGPRARRVDS